MSNLPPWQHPVIILKDVKYEELLGIVQLIYHGEVRTEEDKLASFLQAAETLGIKGLTEDKKRIKKDLDKVKTKTETKEETKDNLFGDTEI